MIDMHIHSNLSDGELEVSSLVELIKKNNLRYVSLTDHDSVKGVEKFIKDCAEKHIIAITGVELEAFIDTNNHKYLHMLGYNYNNLNGLDFFLEKLRLNRINSIKYIIERLNNKGYEISYKDVLNTIIGKHLILNNLCQALEKKRIYDSKFNAYNDLLNIYKEAEYPQPTVEEVIKLIYQFGGIPVLAHPMRIKYNKYDLENYVKYLKSIGLKGIETYYSFNDKEMTEFSKYLSDKYDLFETIGSDWHCFGENIPIGIKDVPESVQKTLLKEVFNEK